MSPLRSNWPGENLFNYGIDLGMNCPLSTREGGLELEEERVRRIIDALDSDVPRERVAGSRTHAARNQAMPSPLAPVIDSHSDSHSAKGRKGDAEEEKEVGEVKGKVTKEEIDELARKFGASNKV